MRKEESEHFSFGKLIVPTLFIIALIAGAIYTKDAKSLEEAVGKEDVIETVYVKEPTPIIVSATHLEEIDGYLKVYDVPDTDRSYYINTSYTYALVDKGLEVVISTTQGLLHGEVTESVEGKFRVKVKDPTLVFNGMSGSVVLHRGEEIGFVSELKENLEILCYTNK